MISRYLKAVIWFIAGVSGRCVGCIRCVDLRAYPVLPSLSKEGRDVAKIKDPHTFFAMLLIIECTALLRSGSVRRELKCEWLSLETTDVTRAVALF